MKAFRVYNVLTNEELGRYDTDTEAYEAHKGQPITVIYRPGRKKKSK